MAVYKRGNVWWYRFTWNGTAIRESTKQTNKRVAEQIEAAKKTALAKGEVGIRDRPPAPTLEEFAKDDFLPFCRSTFAAKVKTLSYYENGTARLLEYGLLANARLDAISTEKISGYIRRRQDAGLKVSSVNRELQVLRRMFALAIEWGKVDKMLPRVRMVPGEAHRDRVLDAAERKAYLDAAQALGVSLLEAYQRAQSGIRATKRGETPIEPQDPFLLRDAVTLLLECGYRPEECFRLRWEYLQSGVIEMPHGKTDNARRRIPLSQHVASLLEMRRAQSQSPWVFPAPTASGHIEPSSLKRQHQKACRAAGLEHFPLYTLRHTCLTAWAPHMDPWTLAYLAGHRDMSITKRYIHPQEHTTRAAMDRARDAQGGHKNGHSAVDAPVANHGNPAVKN
ncbi:MAG: tyrosine-type recombinase/integrase [Bryobacteraceae bacterium]